MTFQPESPEDTIYAALSETFENLVFEEVVIDKITDNERPHIVSDAWWAKIELFPPPIAGEIVIIVPNALMNRFTEATLGMGTDLPSEEENADDLGELLNTLSGRLLAMRVSPDQVYKIGLPKSGRGATSATKNQEYKLVDCLVGNDHIYLMLPSKFWSL